MCETTGNIFLVGDAWCDASNEQSLTEVRVTAVYQNVKNTANTQQYHLRISNQGVHCISVYTVSSTIYNCKLILEAMTPDFDDP